MQLIKTSDMFLRDDPDGIGFYILGKKVKLISRLFISARRE